MLRPTDIIRAKRDGQALSREAIEAFIRGLADGSWRDYQVSALLMAIVLRGMSADETSWLTDAMVRSGASMDLSRIAGPKVGKHSTGGVGDKVSIVLAPLAAACGLIVPKMSGRGLGHTGGTLDKLEAIPGFRVALSMDEYFAALEAVGCCLISQTQDIAPADKTLYALRDVTATIESIPLIAASVMSKKLAEGSDALVLDVKCGGGAFMKTVDDALDLARALVAIGTTHHVRTEALITAMDAPLGRAVGNALEIRECIDTLEGQGPPDLEALILRLASHMVRLGGLATSADEAEARVRRALTSGAALARFERMVERQGGDARIVAERHRLPRARHRHVVAAPVAGYVSRIDAGAVGRASMRLGSGREQVTDVIDPAVGIVLERTVGDPVAQADPVLVLHYNDEARLSEACALVESAIAISAAPPPPRPLVLGWVHEGGESRYP